MRFKNIDYCFSQKCAVVLLILQQVPQPSKAAFEESLAQSRVHPNGSVYIEMKHR